VDALELVIDTPEAGIATFVLNRPAEQAADLMEPALASADHREGVRAFRERRPPRFALLGGAR
jgi:hypothetical protein